VDRRLTEAEATWKAKETQLQAVAHKATERASRAEQNAALKAHRHQENLPRQSAGEKPRKPKRESKPLTRLFSIERPGRMLAVACASLAVLVLSDPIADIGSSFLNGDRPPIELSPAGDRSGTLFVQPSVANMREKASQESPVIGHIRQAAAVFEIARQGAWIQVIVPETGGEQGWIHSSLLGAEPPVQQTP
jgi:hypothetical protein